MVYPRYEFPSTSFPYKISRRLNLLSVPRRIVEQNDDDMPAVNPTGVRKSALNAHITDRVNDASWPYIRRLYILKRQYKKFFTPERLEKLDRMIEASNATIYAKLANCAVDLKKQDVRDTKRKRGWSESEWKKHMDYINQIANPRKEFQPESVKRGSVKPLQQLMPRINELVYLPEYKLYRRLSQESWYRDPTKVSPNAMKYVITDNIKKLATPKAMHAQE